MANDYFVMRIGIFVWGLIYATAFGYGRRLQRADVTAFRSINSVEIRPEHTELFAASAYEALCQSTDYLSERQKQLCADRGMRKTVARGAAMGIEECQHQFRDKRWNCSTNENASDAYGSVLPINSREKAYVHAISAAGVAYVLTKACSQGENPDCSCDQRIFSTPTNGRFQWGGCSDDITFGEKFSRDLLDSRESKFTAEGLMNRHNNEAGRRIVKLNMQTLCKCHGVSGSCSIQFCWRKLSTFAKVGDALSDKFEGAHHVRMNAKKAKLRPKYRGQKWPLKDDLVYLEKSPDFCERNPRFGIGGTKGRRCNKTSPGVDGCGILCCGRGYRTMIKSETKDCLCKFKWCCSVECKKCEVRSEEHICN